MYIILILFTLRLPVISVNILHCKRKGICYCIICKNAINIIDIQSEEDRGLCGFDLLTAVHSDSLMLQIIANVIKG